MTLHVLPDIYRLNMKQRDSLLDLYNEGRIESPVTVSRLTGRRAAACDRAGNAYVIDHDGQVADVESR
jgi:hypothetical protein